MGSITGLKRGSFTSVDNSGEFRLDTDLDPGTAGEVIVSGGPDQPVAWGPNGVAVPNALTMGTNVNLTSGNPSWDGALAETINSIDTDTTYSAGNGMDLTGTTFSTDNDGITINNTGGGSFDQNQVLKVPNDLTAGTNVAFSVGTTYNGDTAITINSTDTTYYAGSGIELLGVPPVNIWTKNDLTTINNLGAGNTNQVLKVPNDLTINGTIFNGSVARNFTLATTDTTYQGGDNITIDTTTTPDTIDLDAALTGMTGITYTGGGGNNLTGAGMPGTGTLCTYLDLTSNTNLFPTLYPNSVSPYLVFTSYDPAIAASQSLTTSSVQLFSGGMSSSFVARGVNVEVELKILSYGGSSNRWLYLTILDGAGTTEWSASMGTGGGYGTGTRPTERLVHYRDETDSDYVSMSWVLTGLTPGNTYIVNPGAKTNLTTNYVYAGGSFPACVFRVIQV